MAAGGTPPEGGDRLPGVAQGSPPEAVGGTELEQLAGWDRERRAEWTPLA